MNYVHDSFRSAAILQLPLSVRPSNPKGKGNWASTLKVGLSVISNSFWEKVFSLYNIRRKLDFLSKILLSILITLTVSTALELIKLLYKIYARLSYKILCEDSYKHMVSTLQFTMLVCYAVFDSVFFLGKNWWLI